MPAVSICLLYTSDAADDSLRVDLGGRRIIKKNEGEKDLVEKIVKKCGSKEFENIDIFLNERQISNLADCLKNLNDTDQIIANQLPFDLLSIEVRDGIKNLSRITGQELTEDLLDNIFSKFCIGK